MKKITKKWITAALAAAAAVSLTACGSGANTQESETGSSEPAVVKVGVVGEYNAQWDTINELLADERINSMLANADNTMANLSHASANLRVMMDKDIPDAMRKLNDIEDNVVVITDKLAGLDYEQTISSVNQTLAEVKSFTSKLNSKDNTIGLLLNDSTMYNNLNSTFENASNLLYDLKAHPKRYVHFSLFGRKE